MKLKSFLASEIYKPFMMKTSDVRLRDELFHILTSS